MNKTFNLGPGIALNSFGIEALESLNDDDDDDDIIEDKTDKQKKKKKKNRNKKNKKLSKMASQTSSVVVSPGKIIILDLRLILVSTHSSSIFLSPLFWVESTSLW